MNNRSAENGSPRSNFVDVHGIDVPGEGRKTAQIGSREYAFSNYLPVHQIPNTEFPFGLSKTVSTGISVLSFPFAREPRTPDRRVNGRLCWPLRGGSAARFGRSAEPFCWFRPPRCASPPTLSRCMASERSLRESGKSEGQPGRTGASC